MAEYIDVDSAIPMSGLRVVLTPGIPGPWSESAKAILHVKKLNFVRAAQEVLGANVALIRWTGQATAPVAAWNDEPPRTTWIEQLALFERLAAGSAQVWITGTEATPFAWLAGQASCWKVRDGTVQDHEI